MCTVPSHPSSSLSFLFVSLSFTSSSLFSPSSIYSFFSSFISLLHILLLLSYPFVYFILLIFLLLYHHHPLRILRIIRLFLLFLFFLFSTLFLILKFQPISCLLGMLLKFIKDSYKSCLPLWNGNFPTGSLQVFLRVLSKKKKSLFYNMISGDFFKTFYEPSQLNS